MSSFNDCQVCLYSYFFYISGLRFNLLAVVWSDKFILLIIKLSHLINFWFQFWLKITEIQSCFTLTESYFNCSMLVKIAQKLALVTYRTTVQCSLANLPFFCWRSFSVGVLWVKTVLETHVCLSTWDCHLELNSKNFFNFKF